LSVMEIEPMDTVEASGEERKPSRLGARVAVTVALLATFLGVCKVKDDNIVQAMERAESSKLDDWNFYQARNIREEVGRGALAQLKLQAAAAPASQTAAYAGAIASYEKLVAEQNAKKDDLQKQALSEEKRYEDLNYRDDQFDLADAQIAIAISLLAITALTNYRWLYWLALVPTV